jgi:hypothetical protein
MVGRLQGSCGEIGGEATTVIIIMIFGLRWDLFQPVRSCLLVVPTGMYVTKDTLGMNHLDSLQKSSLRSGK